MSTAAMESEIEREVGDRTAEAARGIARMSDQAQLLGSRTVDALEEARQAAQRAWKQRLEDAEHLRDGVVQRVKGEPLQAIGVAFGVGAVIGLATGWIARGYLHRR